MGSIFHERVVTLVCGAAIFVHPATGPSTTPPPTTRVLTYISAGVLCNDVAGIPFEGDLFELGETWSST